jgi:hypothetical protein
MSNDPLRCRGRGHLQQTIFLQEIVQRTAKVSLFNGSLRTILLGELPPQGAALARIELHQAVSIKRSLRRHPAKAS